jgi:hypothetical protein
MNRIQEDLSLALTEQIRTAIDERTREVADQVIKDISSRIFNSQESDEYYTEEELEELRLKDNHIDKYLSDKIIIGRSRKCESIEITRNVTEGYNGKITKSFNHTEYVIMSEAYIDIYGNIYYMNYEMVEKHNDPSSYDTIYINRGNGYTENCNYTYKYPVCVGVTKIMKINLRLNRFCVDLIVKCSSNNYIKFKQTEKFRNHKDNWQPRVDEYITVFDVTPIFEKIVELYAKHYPHKDTLTTILDNKISNEKILKDIRSERAALEAMKQELAKKELKLQEKEKSFKIKDSMLVDREIRVTEKELIYSKIDNIEPLIEGVKSVSIKLNTLLSSEIDGKVMSSNVKKHTMSAIKAELDEVVEQLYKQ